MGALLAAAGRPRAGGGGRARALAFTALLAGGALSHAQTPRPSGDAKTSGPSTPLGHSDAAVRRAWARLAPSAQEEACACFASELEQESTFQVQLVRYVIATSEVDPGFFEEDAPAACYDPQVHAPAQPIARRRLDPASAAARAERERLFARFTPRPPAAWRYDWGRRAVRRTGDERSPQHVFERALAGEPPRGDLAEALVEQALDRGPERELQACFDHAYTDREGCVYPGITLYDAWCSGERIEMPDVDVLGIVHDALGEWKRWVAPIPASEHGAVYAQVGALFRRARAHRALRSALASALARGSPALRDGYEHQLERLHGLWESSASMPSELAPRLPSSETLEAFLGEWALRYEEDSDLIARARARRATLERDSARVRALFLDVLGRFGAFDDAPARERDGASGGG